jgi:hypothetical protein
MLNKPLSLVLYLLLFSVAIGMVMVLALSAFNIPFHGLFFGEIVYFAGITFLLLMIVLLIAFLAPKNVAIALVLVFACLYLAFLAFSVARLMLLSRKPRPA